MDETCLRLEIRGRVQGVGYRWNLVQQARRLGLRGWVRNRRDGSVEALVAGPAAALEPLLAWARRGPAGAAVSAVEVFEPAREGWPTPGQGFEQAPTV